MTKSVENLERELRYAMFFNTRPRTINRFPRVPYVRQLVRGIFFRIRLVMNIRSSSSTSIYPFTENKYKKTCVLN